MGPVGNGTGPDEAALAVGLWYLATGVVFIPLHLMCAYLIYVDKEMKNPTYEFMINLSIADSLELACISVYSGIVLVTNAQYEPVDRCVRFVLSIAFYTSCVVMVLMAFSRWVTITKWDKVDAIFTRRRMVTLHAIPWCFFAAANFYPQAIRKEFSLSLTTLTWTFDLSTAYGRFLHWNNFGFNSVCVAAEATFNVLSVRRVHALRASIGQAVDTDETQKKEVKLLLQCFLVGLAFFTTDVTFTASVVSGWESRAWLLFVTAMWFWNHCVNPVVYLSLNSRLRSSFLNKITCAHPFRWWSETAPNLGRIGGNERVAVSDSDQDYYSAVSSQRSSVLYMSTFGDPLSPTEAATPTKARPRRVTYGAVDVAPLTPPRSPVTPSGKNPAKRPAQRDRREQRAKRGGPIGWLQAVLGDKKTEQPRRLRTRTGSGVGIGDRGVPRADHGYRPKAGPDEHEHDPEAQYQHQQQAMAARGFPNTSPLVAGTRDFKLFSEFVKSK